MTDNPKVLHLSSNPWRSKSALADALGVTTRTITNRVIRGEIEKRETNAGVLFRLAEMGQESEERKEEGKGKESVSPALQAIEESYLSQGRKEEGKGEITLEGALLVEALARLTDAVTVIAELHTARPTTSPDLDQLRIERDQLRDERDQLRDELNQLRTEATEHRARLVELEQTVDDLRPDADAWRAHQAKRAAWRAEVAVLVDGMRADAERPKRRRK
jgi:uncharacterized coiled-coil DUF342 family protein